MAGDVRRFGGVGDACDDVLHARCRQRSAAQRSLSTGARQDDANDEDAFERSPVSPAFRKRTLRPRAHHSSH